MPYLIWYFFGLLLSPITISSQFLCLQKFENFNIFLFGLIARDDPIKGHEDFLKAISLVSNSHGILVGDGITSSDRIRNKIDMLNISHKVSLFEQNDDIQNFDYN